MALADGEPWQPADGVALTAGAPACLVADTFESYEGIRGVIVQGTLDGGVASARARLVRGRTTTCSFANVSSH